MNLTINNDTLIQYDRIYVGAGVTDQEEQFLTSLLKIDGILVMPLNDSVIFTFKKENYYFLIHFLKKVG